MHTVLNPMVEPDPSPPAFVPGPAGTHITIRNLTKYFAGWPLYENFNLDIPKNQIVSVFGPNGCGKSTLINMIAGLIPFDSGEILFDGKSLKDTHIGYVFQNYREALFPWMRTIDNIAYPLKLAGKSKGDVAQRVDELVASFDVKFDLNRYPYELSGGQQQTASIMRALAPNPEVLFLDEPFSALDFEMTLFIREKLQDVFINRKIPADQRRGLVVATTLAGEIFWVEGLPPGEAFKVGPATTERLTLRWRRDS
jgi:NitT/TauT family transport system ATP-binding protein